MRPVRRAGGRWLMSFADLCLLLLGFFVLLQAQRGQAGAVSAGMRAAFGGVTGASNASDAAADWFEPGEAVFRAGVADRLRVLGAQAGTRRVTVESRGADRSGRRFDAWELAAARAAAVARAVAAGGVDPARVDLVMTPSHEAGAQVIVVRMR
ncbi:flagellar motor protein MotB [Sphingomonas montana]|uniref:flagellar motor protein MotB n=1 Tax=Sphingomonas montana TaxID=1843236 RepID=UPI00096CA773|nr:flagellar motor protein MotB [Sphingomonas montana]